MQLNTTLTKSQLMAKPLVIFGTKQIAEIAHFYFTREGGRNVVAFTVDRNFMDAAEFLGKPVVPFEEVEKSYPPATHDMFVAVSYQKVNRIREAKFHEAKAKGYALATFISPRAIFHKDVSAIGENCMVQELNNIQPYVRIGDNVYLWAGNHIGHHSVIGSHCFIASHAVISGDVAIGERCFIGVNATLRDNITIAPDCVLGAGVTILHNTNEGEVLVGPEAKTLPMISGELKKL